MTNVIQLSKSQGFTRMDNEIYEALIGADLSGRELRVALAIHRLTAGYNVATSRIAAATIAQLANLRRENVSRMVSELIRQRVIYRAGGSKGPLGLSPVSEWRIDPKNDDKKAESNSTQCVISDTSLVSFPTHIKDRKDINTTDVVLRTARDIEQVKPAKAPKAKAETFTLSNLLSNNPHGASEQVLSDWMTCRRKLRAAVTVTVWKRVNDELAKCVAAGISADDALAEAQEAGWRGFKFEWIVNRRSGDARKPVRQSNAPDFHSNDTSWADDLGYL